MRWKVWGSNLGWSKRTMSSPKHSDQISKENCTDIQQANGWIVDEFPEEGFTPWLVDSYRVKGAAIIVCHEETDQGLVG